MASIASAPQVNAGFWSSPPSADSLDYEDAPPRADLETAARSAHSVAGLVKMVESEIIPRLMLAHRGVTASAVPAYDPEGMLGPHTTETFARMVVSRDSESLIGFVGNLLRAGVSLDAIYTDLLVPAARRLGDYWDEDSASFTDVTVGLGRLQQVLRAMAWKTPMNGDRISFSRSALFAPGPGEQHIFGLFIVEDFFRRAGWNTWVETAASKRELIDTVAAHWFDVFGMTVSGDTWLEEITADIQAIRAASRNPKVVVLVGGRLFIERPELVLAVGADATAASGGEALLIANHALLLADNAVSALTAGA